MVGEMSTNFRCLRSVRVVFFPEYTLEGSVFIVDFAIGVWPERRTWLRFFPVYVFRGLWGARRPTGGWGKWVICCTVRKNGRPVFGNRKEEKADSST